MLSIKTAYQWHLPLRVATRLEELTGHHILTYTLSQC